MSEIVIKGAVKREEGYLYYVDGEGNVCRAKMSSQVKDSVDEFEDCKIYRLEDEELPNYVTDDIDFLSYYEEKGYECLGGVSDESRMMKFKRKTKNEQKNKKS